MKTSSSPSQSVADVGTTGPNPLTIARFGFSLVRGLNRAADDSLNRAQMQRFVAAGGEVRGRDPNRPIGRNNPPGYYFGGQQISEDRARAIQRVQTVRPQAGYQSPPMSGPPEPLLNPPVPGGGSSGSSGQGIPPGGSRPPPPRGGTPPINPMPPVPVRVNWWPAAVISVIGPYVLPGAKRAGELGWEWYQQGRPLPKGPKTRRRRSPHRGPGPGARQGQGDPFPPGGSPPQVTVNVPPAPAARVPRAERVASILGELGGDVYVNPRRLPVPRTPAPRPVPPPAKSPWSLATPFLPAMLSAFLVPGGARARRRDPLTQPQPDSPGAAFPDNAPGLTPFYSSGVSFGSFGPPAGTVGTNTCECKAPKPKRRKRKRTVCYSGTYIERADGTRKSKKRKVPCK